VSSNKLLDFGGALDQDADLEMSKRIFCHCGAGAFVRNFVDNSRSHG